MTGEWGEWLILRDDAGDYYLIDRQTLEQARIPADRIGEIDQLLQANDTVGFGEPPAAGALVGMLRVVGALHPDTPESR